MGMRRRPLKHVTQSRRARCSLPQSRRACAMSDQLSPAGAGPGKGLVGTTGIAELLIGIRPAAGGEVEQGPHRLDRSAMPRILARIGWLEQELGGPAQPDDAVGILVEYRQHRHLLTFLIFPVIVALEAVPGGRYHLKIAPAVMG